MIKIDLVGELIQKNNRFRLALETIAYTQAHPAGQTVNEYHFQKLAKIALGESDE